MACSPTLDCFIMERETPPELSFITLNGGEVRFQEEIRHTNGITFSGSDDIGNKFYFNLHLVLLPSHILLHLVRGPIP